jgi:hypothetical protein
MLDFGSFNLPDGSPDIAAYLAYVAEVQASALADVHIAFTRDEVAGSVRWRGVLGDLVVCVFEPHIAIGSRYGVYVGHQHYASEDTLNAAMVRAREAAGYYAGLSPNSMGRMASERERETARSRSATIR